MSTATAPTSDTRRGAGFLPPPGPGRTLYWAILINTVGTGMYITSSAIFFVRYIGLPATEVGLGLSLGGLTGLVIGPSIGRLCDRLGPRDIYATALLIEAAGMCALTRVHTMGQFLALVLVAGLAATSTSVARGPLIQALATGRAAVLRAHLRSAANIGITLGGAVGGLAIAADHRPLYPLLVLGNALSFLCCGLMALRLPRTVPTPAGTNRKRRAVKDLPYLGVTAVSAIMMLQYPVLSLVLPLWIYSRTALPHWLVAALIPVNTLLVVLLQVRVAKNVDTPDRAARLMPRAGLAFLIAFAVIAALGALPVALSAALLVGAVISYTLGEILQGTASYELALTLAPDDARGEYFGTYTTGTELGRVASSAIVTWLCLTWGWPGWLLLGALMLGAGAITPALTRRALWC
ncbi:MFS transporter [Streptomyces sp. NPDC001828]|uniref:MFS transporter n=1 Tax=Streptomyces sp. NPDC001828 TaxID=3364615 RepID=UPI0036C457C1